MVKKSGYIWIIVLVLLVLIIDIYYQIQDSVIPVWQTEWFIWRVFALIVILLGLILYFYLASTKKRKNEFEKFKKKIIDNQENEWRIIAGELHDSIGQNLSAVNIYLQQNIKSSDENADNLKNASDLIMETIEEVRRISQKLYPKQIERLGLTVSTQAMINKIESVSQIKFLTSIDNIDNILSRENEVQYFRIIQEIINNIIKHSGAKNVVINIKKSIMFIVTEIEDDGIGFEITNTTKLGLGLINIEERIQMIRGTYEFKSEQGSGTKFKITIPTK